MTDAPLLRGIVGGDAGPRAVSTVTVITPAGRQIATVRVGADGRYAVPVPAPGAYLLIRTTAEDAPHARWVNAAEPEATEHPAPVSPPPEVDRPARPAASDEDSRPDGPAVGGRATLYGLVAALLAARLRADDRRRGPLIDAARRLAGPDAAEPASRAARELLEPLAATLCVPAGDPAHAAPVLGAAGTPEVVAVLRPLVAALVTDLSGRRTRRPR